MPRAGTASGGICRPKASDEWLFCVWRLCRPRPQRGPAFGIAQRLRLARACSKLRPACRHRANIKLVVRSQCPLCWGYGLPQGPVMGPITGVPPPTLASNRKHAPCSFAMRISSAPFSATSSLFDVTAQRPLSSAARILCGVKASDGLHHHLDVLILQNGLNVFTDPAASWPEKSRMSQICPTSTGTPARLAHTSAFFGQYLPHTAAHGAKAQKVSHLRHCLHSPFQPSLIHRAGCPPPWAGGATLRQQRLCRQVHAARAERRQTPAQYRFPASTG